MGLGTIAKGPGYSLYMVRGARGFQLVLFARDAVQTGTSIHDAYQSFRKGDWLGGAINSLLALLGVIGLGSSGFGLFKGIKSSGGVVAYFKATQIARDAQAAKLLKTLAEGGKNDEQVLEALAKLKGTPGQQQLAQDAERLLLAASEAQLANDAAKALGIMGCFVAGTLTRVAVPLSATVAAEPTPKSLEGSSSAFAYGDAAIPIEDVALGQRVPSQNPLHEEFYHTTKDEDYIGWKVINIEVRHANGSTVDVQLLRSEDWIERNKLYVGKRFDLRLTEIELNASGFVVSILDGPEVLPGIGAVVTGRFVTRQGSDLVRVTFSDGTELVGTSIHPVWSPERMEWRGLGEFEPGQFVRTRNGLMAVASVELLSARPSVYNIEVDGEHVYEVTDLGILVHNGTAFDCARFAKLLKRGAGVGKPLSPAERAELAALTDQLNEMNLKQIIGTDPPAGMNNRHVHHILFKKGVGREQQKLVAEGILILHKNGIDFTTAANLVWAPNQAGQHTLPNLTKVLVVLRKLDKAGADTEEFLEALEKLGDEAAGR
jgi:hypothetical protein